MSGDICFTYMRLFRVFGDLREVGGVLDVDVLGWSRVGEVGG